MSWQALMLIHTPAEALEKHGGGIRREGRTNSGTEKHKSQLPMGKSDDTSQPGL